MARDDEFTRFVAVRGSALRRTAYLMTGDWHDAEDLAQTALTRLYVAWPRVRLEGADAFARTILARSLVDSRRRFWRRESPTSDLPEIPDAEDHAEDRVDLERALAMLPVSHRVVLVLRFWEDMTVEQVAGALSISAGTVKSRTSRALESLRATMGPDVVRIGEELQS